MGRKHDSTAPLRILLVDDDADIREAMQTTLELLLDYRPHAVTPASNGAEALDELRRSPPDLVLLDLMMPIMSGSELLAVMRRDEASATCLWSSSRPGPERRPASPEPRGSRASLSTWMISFR